MQAAASRGRWILVDRQTREIVWIEGPGSHTPPTSFFRGAEMIRVHEPMTHDADLALGQKYGGV